MIVAYVAGPFTGRNAYAIEKNVRRAESVALHLWRNRVAALCPHANTRFFHEAAPREVFLEGDLEMMKRCDVVVLAPGWELSEGAKQERAMAEGLGMAIYEYGTYAFDLWLATLPK